MNRIIFIVSFIISVNCAMAQNDGIMVLNTTAEIKDESYHIRAYKDESLMISIKTEVKNEKKGNQFTLDNIKIYRQNAGHEFQYIVDKNEVDEFNISIKVPSDGIYTLVFDRGGMKKFETTLTVKRIPSVSGTPAERKALMVQIPDTIHTYKKDSVIYDKVRVSTPKTKKERTPQYFEDQIFMDVAYALRFGNEYAIPIVLPQEILTDYKIAKSVELGFSISVGDEVYKAFQKKISQVASAAVSAGMGKAMSGKTDEATGLVSSGKLSKSYEVFDKLSTANAIAGISGDIGEQSGSKNVTVSSDAVQVMTGFTGLSDMAGDKIGSFAPKIEDQIIYKLLTQNEYQKYINKQPYTCLKEGKNGFASGNFEIIDHRMNYYLIIKNERGASGGALDILESVGKTILSQYVYTNVKVFVKRKVEITYDKGYFENSFMPLYNPVWVHTEIVNTKNVVIFEDESRPYYKPINVTNIY